MYLYTVPITNVTITSDIPSPIIEGVSVTLTCIVEMNALVESDLRLFDLEVTLSRGESPVVNLSEPAINGTTSTYTHRIVSFNRNKSGNYRCATTARPHPSSIFINGSDALSLSGVLRVTTSKTYWLVSLFENVLGINFFRCIPEVKMQNLQQKWQHNSHQ